MDAVNTMELVRQAPRVMARTQSVRVYTPHPMTVGSLLASLELLRQAGAPETADVDVEPPTGIVSPCFIATWPVAS